MAVGSSIWKLIYLPSQLCNYGIVRLCFTFFSVFFSFTPRKYRHQFTCNIKLSYANIAYQKHFDTFWEEKSYMHSIRMSNQYVKSSCKK